MKRLGRFRFFSYVVVTVLIVLGGARLVLSSAFAADKVADRLGVLLGVPVRVARVDIGIGGGSSFQGLQIFEDDNARPEMPWVRADDVSADFSAVDMFGDDSLPKEIVLNGAHVELRFAKDGSLLTRLPKTTDSTQALPKLRLENARVTIKQEGRERRPLVVTGVTADFTYADRAFRFEGTCADAYWGDWTVVGSYDAVKDDFRLALRSERTAVNAEKLTLLPFIPDSVWEEVKITEGVTPAEIDLTSLGTDSVKYRIALKPTNTRVHVSSIDLEAEAASGEVVIEDDVVRLSNVKGRTANGSMGTEAVLDFREDNARLSFESIWLNDVDLHRLPDSWGLKQHKITGKLTGKAKLDVRVKVEGVDMEGSGKGAVTVDIFPLPITLKLTAVKDKINIFPARSGLFRGL